MFVVYSNKWKLNSEPNRVLKETPFVGKCFWLVFPAEGFDRTRLRKRTWTRMTYQKSIQKILRDSLIEENPGKRIVNKLIEENPAKMEKIYWSVVS